ncbi:MAG: hypothetical protein ER33_04645, partial [Cyanobium sp. CACIAM 14]
PLNGLLLESLGEDWPVRQGSLRELERYADDAAFLERWAGCKLLCKRRLAGIIHQHVQLSVDPGSLFDVQVKRIHEYKRQHLNALQLICQYLRIKNGDTDGMVPRTVIFGGKAAPGYAMAKLIIRFINGIAEVVNRDPDVRGLLKIVFLADFNVKLAEKIYPAADLSEQISTAGLEASGTGNMKFTMNGALTIGTLDGANVEIRQQVGGDNFFLFGKTSDQIAQLQGHYRPWELLDTLPLVAEAFRLIDSGFFSQGDGDLLQPLTRQLRGSDPFFVLADCSDYLRAQHAVGRTWSDRHRWRRLSLLNTARSGHFSSDRAIAEYAAGIWQVRPIRVDLGTAEEG